MTTARPQSATPGRVLFVTGTPGAGKSAVAQALLSLDIDALVFDADWLLESTSHLVGRPMAEADDLWPGYDRLWMAILEMVAQNHRAALLLTPMEPRSLPTAPWSARTNWCLLDCDDDTRTSRLQARGWSTSAIAEALADAQALRDQFEFVVDTSNTTPREAAERVAAWAQAHIHHGSPTT